MTDRERLTWAAVEARLLAGVEGWRRSGAEWAGPCPTCGGRDRAHVRRADVDGAGVAGLCRGCGMTGIDLGRALLGGAEYPGGASGVPPAADPAPRPADPLSGAVWARTVRVEAAGPGAAYLAGRGLLSRSGVEGLPPGVGWLPVEAARAVGLRPALPRGAAGALCYLFAARGEPDVHAVQFEPLRADGERLRVKVPGKRKTRVSVLRADFGGGRRVFAAGAGVPGAGVHLCESAPDALALAGLAADGVIDLAGAAVVAAAGAAGLTLAAVEGFEGAIVIRAQDDRPSVLAAARLLRALARMGRTAEIRRPAEGLTGRDWADLARESAIEREGMQDG